VEWAASEFVSVERDVERIISLSGQCERSGVITVVIVSCANIDVTLVGYDNELVATKVFIVSVLVSGLDGESEAGETSGGVVGT